MNIPAHIALHRSYLAQFRGDAEGTAAFAAAALTELNEGEWMLSSTIHGFLAVAEWLAAAVRPGAPGRGGQDRPAGTGDRRCSRPAASARRGTRAGIPLGWQWVFQPPLAFGLITRGLASSGHG